MSKTCIVTGGAGFIGSHLVELLLKNGFEVRIIDNLSTGKLENLNHHNDNPGLSFFEKDICDADSMEIYKNTDIVFHLAAIPRVQRSFKQPLETNRVNVTGTLNVLENSRKAGVNRLVFASSSSVYGQVENIPIKETVTLNSMSPYALQKLMSEKYVRFYSRIHNMDTVCLRYFNVYGPRQNPHEGYANLIPKSIYLVADNKSPQIFGDGDQRRDFTFVTDVVKATLMAALTNEPEVIGNSINIGFGSNKSVNEVVSIICNQSAIKPAYLPPLKEPRETEADISKAMRLLKWRPEIDIETGLNKTIAWFRKEEQLINKIEYY